MGSEYYTLSFTFTSQPHAVGDELGLRAAEDGDAPCTMQQARVEAEAVLFDCTQQLLEKLHIRPSQASQHLEACIRAACMAHPSVS